MSLPLRNPRWWLILPVVIQVFILYCIAEMVRVGFYWVNRATGWIGNRFSRAQDRVDAKMIALTDWAMKDRPDQQEGR